VNIYVLEELFGAPKLSKCELYCKTITFKIGSRNVIRDARNMFFDRKKLLSFRLYQFTLIKRFASQSLYLSDQIRLLWFSSKLALFKNPSFLPACRDNLQRCREADDERLEDFLGSRGAGADLAQCRRTHCGGYQASGCARLATGCSANRQANHRQVLTTSRCATCRPTCSAGAKGPDAAEDRLCEDAGPKPESRSSPNGLVWPQTGIDSTRALHIGECLCRRLITRGYFSLLKLMRKTEKGGIPEKQGTFGGER
jgi:hypothetical protein